MREQNAITKAELEASPDFEPIHNRLLSIYDSNARIPYGTKRGSYYYNFWRDADHVRGIWRRTSPEQYQRKDPAWETVLDLDALATSEKENWVWKGEQFVYPDYDRALVNLSRGGGDSVVVREFDVRAKAFVKDGFALTEAKSQIGIQVQSWTRRIHQPLPSLQVRAMAKVLTIPRMRPNPATA